MTTISIFESSAPEEQPTETRADFGHKEFESRLRWLESEGVKVQRYKLPLDAGWSSINPTVKSAVEAQGSDCLPIVTVDENIISVAGYPTPIEVMEAVGRPRETDPEFLHGIEAERTGLRAALAMNDLQKFQDHWEHLMALGIPGSEAVESVLSALTTMGNAVQDNMRTCVEQWLALGPSGKPREAPCACSNRGNRP